MDHISFEKGILTDHNGIVAFTDGSCLNDKSGYGFPIKDTNFQITKEAGYLGTLATVYQAEVAYKEHVN